MSDKDSHGKVSSLDPGPNGHLPIDYRGKFSVCPGNLLRKSTTTLIIDLNFSSHSSPFPDGFKVFLFSLTFFQDLDIAHIAS